MTTRAIIAPRSASASWGSHRLSAINLSLSPGRLARNLFFGEKPAAQTVLRYVDVLRSLADRYRPGSCSSGSVLSSVAARPVDFLRRVARLIPAPKFNLVRYGGAFSSNSSLRDRIIPRLPASRCTCRHTKSAPGAESSDAASAASSTLPAELTALGAPASGAPSPTVPLECVLLPALLGPSPPSEQQREVRDRYLDWASLLKRVFHEDILLCPKCGHRPTRVIAAIDDPPLVERVLDHLRLPTGRPAISPAPQVEFVDDVGDSDFAVVDEFEVN